MGIVNGFHCGSEPVVERLVILNLGISRIARRKRLDQSAVHRFGVFKREAHPEGFMRAVQGWCFLFWRKKLPRLVVIWTDGIRDAPMRQSAGRVGLQRLFKAHDGLFMIIGEQPDQAPVKPDLCDRNITRWAAIAAQVEIIRHDKTPPWFSKDSTNLRPRLS